MSQPPDDRRPMPWDTPDPQAPADQPTVAWSPQDGDASPEPTSPEPTPPEPDSTGFAGASGPPVGWGGDATPPVAPDVVAPETPTPAQSPLISAAPAPAVSWDAPQAAAREVAPGLVFASTASRFVAFLLDLIIIGIVASIIVSVTGLSGMPATLAAAVLGGFYFVLSWSGGRRATLGQRLLSIQVGNAFDGAALTLEQAIRRWLGLGLFLGAFVFAPGLAAISRLIQLVWIIALLVTTATSPTKQGLHDRFANTALVRPSTAGNAIVWGCLILLLLVVVLAVIGLAAFFSSDAMQTILSEIGDSI